MQKSTQARPYRYQCNLSRIKSHQQNKIIRRQKINSFATNLVQVTSSFTGTSCGRRVVEVSLRRQTTTVSHCRHHRRNERRRRSRRTQSDRVGVAERLPNLQSSRSIWQLLLPVSLATTAVVAFFLSIFLWQAKPAIRFSISSSLVSVQLAIPKAC